MALTQQHTVSLNMPAVDQAAILRHLGINANDPAAQALILVCQKYDLDPILKHALLIQGHMYVTRDGLLHVAHRSGKFDGMEVLEQGETATHFTAKVSVYRKDMGRPFTYIGRHPKGGRGPGAQYGPEMAVKVAEVMALRRAFDVALGAAEERWDEEAQKELQGTAAQKSAPEEMGADVQVDEDGAMTVEVRQEEKAAPAPQPDEEHIKKWGSKLAGCREGLKKYGVSGEEVSNVLAGYEWRSSETEAQKAYDYLVEWGTRLKAEREQEAQVTSDPAPITEELATSAQIQQLQAIARSAGASTSEDRALLWGHKLKQPAPIGTKELTEAQAAELLREFELTDADARKQLLAEAKKEAQGRLI